MTIAGKVIAVTGANGNLGTATVEAALAAHAKVARIVRNPDKFAGDEREGLLGTFTADMLDRDSCVETIRRIEMQSGPIDGFVHTVGGFEMGKITESGEDLWQRMWTANVRTAVNMAAAVAASMKAHGRGSLVFVGATAAIKAPAAMSAYAASKSAVLRLVESSAQELKSLDIRVNCVLPGVIDTPQNRAAMPKADPATWVPPADIAEVILFLLSEKSRAITGAAIPVTGRG